MKIRLTVTMCLAAFGISTVCQAMTEISGDHFNEQLDWSSGGDYQISKPGQTGILSIVSSEQSNTPINLTIGSNISSDVMYYFSPEGIKLNNPNSSITLESVNLGCYVLDDHTSESNVVTSVATLEAQNIHISSGASVKFENKYVNYDTATKEISPGTKESYQNIQITANNFTGSGDIHVTNNFLSINTQTSTHNGTIYLHNSYSTIEVNSFEFNSNFHVTGSNNNVSSIYFPSQYGGNDEMKYVNYTGKITVENSSVSIASLKGMNLSNFAFNLGEHNLLNTGAETYNEHFALYSGMTSTIDMGNAPLVLDISLADVALGEVYTFCLINFSSPMLSLSEDLLNSLNLSSELTPQTISLDQFALSEEAQKHWEVVGFENKVNEWSGGIYISLKAIPEPSSVTLGLLGFSVLLLRRKRL